MLRSIVIFTAGGLLGTLFGIAVGLFVYPYLFLADIVATEQVEGREQRQVVATGSFVHVNPADPIHYGSGRVTVYHDLVHLEDDFEVGPGPKFHVYAGLSAAAQAGEFQVTIANSNPGQNFSPPVLVLHRAGYQLFELGRPASEALWQLAEEGSTAAFEALADPGVQAVVIVPAVHRRNAPVVTTMLEAPDEAELSLAAMLSLTNDGFVAARGLALPQAVGASVAAELRAYDAGSEANTESCEHVPCEVHGRRMTDGAEGAVAPHPGLRGDADIPQARQWHEPVLGTLTITRLR